MRSSIQMHARTTPIRPCTLLFRFVVLKGFLTADGAARRPPPGEAVPTRRADARGLPTLPALPSPRPERKLGEPPFPMPARGLLLRLLEALALEAPKRGLRGLSTEFVVAETAGLRGLLLRVRLRLLLLPPLLPETVLAFSLLLRLLLLVILAALLLVSCLLVEVRSDPGGLTTTLVGGEIAECANVAILALGGVSDVPPVERASISIGLT